MKKLLIIPAFLLLGTASFSANANASMSSTDDFACTAQTTNGSVSVTAPTCRQAMAGLKAALGIK